MSDVAQNLLTPSGDGESLLSIDVDAEVGKLCEHQVPSRGALVVELVRLAVALGASEVRIAVGRREVALVAPGASLPPGSAADLAEVADPHHPASARHAALVRTEATHGAALLALLGEQRARLISCRESSARQLHFRRGHPVESSDSPAEAAASLQIVVACHNTRRAVRAALARACRFARLPIFVDGRRVSEGDPAVDCLVHNVTDGPLGELWVGLPRAAELGLTVTLQHEVVVREAYGLSPHGYVHTALLRQLVGLNPDELARAVRDQIQAQRRALFVELRRRAARLAPADLSSARDLLLRRAEKSGQLGELTDVPLFECADGQRVDLNGLRERASQGLYAIEAGERPGRYLMPLSVIFRLDARTREFLARVVGMSAQEPPVLQPRTWWRTASAAARRVGGAATRGRRRLAGSLLGAAIVPEVELSPQEARLLAAVADEVHSGRFRLPGLSQAVSKRVEVVMSSRGGLPAPLRRRGERWRWLLPRHHVVVARFDAAVDSVHLHPMMLALSGGFDGYGGDKERIHRAALAAD